MKILGVDYGRAKIGIAVAEGKLADPLKVVKVNSVQDAIEKIVQVVKEEEVEKVIVGIAEGNIADEQTEFVQELEKHLKVPIETWDETLTTQDAQTLAIEAGLPQKKRRVLEDAFAASVMLQSYLDSAKGSK
ncbi:Holliday junction resolvase RuvX [Candidatus Woesebacteria bacterium]|nr:Holliday junction resolvase RuvX [Candidatus Woesebacteria bacterium]